MPSIAQQPYGSVSCKKRRRGEDDEAPQLQMRLSSNFHSNTHRPFVPLKPTPSTKRQRVEIPPLQPPQTTSPYPSPVDLLSYTPQPHPHPQAESYFQPSAQAAKETAKKKDLSPCHICHRRPTVMRDLDAYTNCEGCGERTCYICVRECVGFSGMGREESGEGMGEKREGKEEGGHRGMVCSRCCVERGTEGEVWCFGCLRSSGGGG